MKYFRCLIFLFGFVTISLSQSFEIDDVYDSDLRYWESPQGESFTDQQVDLILSEGTWTYYKITEDYERVNIFTREVECTCNDVDVMCLPIVEVGNCYLSYDLPNDCENTPYWLDPMNMIHNGSEIEAFVDGQWKLVYDQGCKSITDVINVALCKPPTLDVVCDHINTSSVLSEGDWSMTFESGFSGDLTLLFDTKTLPDALEIRINGGQYSYSQFYSSNLCVNSFEECSEFIVPGCNQHYSTNVSITQNDYVQIYTYSSDCGVEESNWDLIAMCDDVIMPRQRKPDDYNTGETNSILVFPNPVKSRLNLVLLGKDAPSSINLLSTTGVVMERIVVVGEQIGIDVSSLPSGVYVLEAVVVF